MDITKYLSFVYQGQEQDNEFQYLTNHPEDHYSDSHLLKRELCEFFSSYFHFSTKELSEKFDFLDYHFERYSGPPINFREFLLWAKDFALTADIQFYFESYCYHKPSFDLPIQEWIEMNKKKLAKRQPAILKGKRVGKEDLLGKVNEMNPAGTIITEGPETIPNPENRAVREDPPFESIFRDPAKAKKLTEDLMSSGFIDVQGVWAKPPTEIISLYAALATKGFLHEKLKWKDRWVVITRTMLGRIFQAKFQTGYISHVTARATRNDMELNRYVKFVESSLG